MSEKHLIPKIVDVSPAFIEAHNTFWKPLGITPELRQDEARLLAEKFISGVMHARNTEREAKLVDTVIKHEDREYPLAGNPPELGAWTDHYEQMLRRKLGQVNKEKLLDLLKSARIKNVVDAMGEERHDAMGEGPPEERARNLIAAVVSMLLPEEQPIKELHKRYLSP